MTNPEIKMDSSVTTIKQKIHKGVVTEVDNGAKTFEASPLAAAINVLSTDINDWAKEKGFWESWDDAKFIEELGNKIMYESLEDGKRLHEIASRIRTLTLASKIALMHSELSEALETLRDTGADNLDSNFLEELTDCFIRIQDTVGQAHGSLGDETLRKMKVNEGRPHRHGRVF